MHVKIRGDFNGLFATPEGGVLLCLSHSDSTVDDKGEPIILEEGMSVTAFDEDLDDKGNRDDLIANGVVIRSPEWLRCKGSTWALEVDDRGYYHESDALAGS